MSRSTIGAPRCATSSAVPACCCPSRCRARRIKSPPPSGVSGSRGVVAKRTRSTYAAGRRSDAWIKVRFARHQELVVGGYKPTAKNFDSLVVGYYEDARLICAGKVRNGLTPHSRAELFERMRPLQRKRCPFANLPTGTSSHWGEGITEEEMQTLQWLKPGLVAEISFVEWTRDGSLRHAAFLGLRDDKLARDVRREDQRNRRDR